MANLFTLTNQVKSVAQNAIDSLIDQLGKDCLLIYPPTPIACPNCIPDPIGNKSSNKWITGGPMEFYNGPCPVCNGEGVRYDNHTETIRQLISSEPSKFFIKPPAGIQIPDGMIQCKTYFSHINKIVQSQEMVLQPSVQNTIRWRYKLVGEPVDVGNIIQNRYIVSIWRRSG